MKNESILASAAIPSSARTVASYSFSAAVIASMAGLALSVARSTRLAWIISIST